MPPHRRSRNAPCPCGSGKKYKHCCQGKGFDWVEDAQGSTFRQIPLSPEASALLEEQERRFRQRFGRDPGPDDRVFFDAPPLEQVEHQLVEAMKQAGIDPAIIHAFEKTGLLVTEENQHLIPEKDLQQWADAVAEYNREHNPPKYPLATVAWYGPDAHTTTKIAVGIFTHPDAEPILRRWVGSRVVEDAHVQQQIQQFLEEHGVKYVAMSEGNLGCPHEEGEDFPLGGDCPFCPFWKGKQGSNRRE